MDTVSTRLSSRLSPSIKWSIYAGIYGFLCSVMLLLVLGSLARTLIKLLGLPIDYSVFLMALPVLFIGSVVWWTVVERWDKYTYLFGGVAGILTVLFTVLFWVLIFAIIWGPLLVLTGWFLILFVLLVSIPVGFIAGLPLIYARNHLDDSL